jgi:hypothetical protein
VAFLVPELVMGFLGIAIGFLGIAMGFLRGNGRCSSIRSITTAFDVKNVLATEAACSIQHLTTCTDFQDIYNT